MAASSDPLLDPQAEISSALSVLTQGLGRWQVGPPCLRLPSLYRVSTRLYHLLALSDTLVLSPGIPELAWGGIRALRPFCFLPIFCLRSEAKTAQLPRQGVGWGRDAGT